ncbi:hypothetical protein Trydic_g18176 [Trypoxylus dichotomus]
MENIIQSSNEVFSQNTDFPRLIRKTSLTLTQTLKNNSSIHLQRNYVFELSSKLEESQPSRTGPDVLLQISFFEMKLMPFVNSQRGGPLHLLPYDSPEKARN